MKKYLIIIILSLLTLNASAYSFKYNGLYFTITSEEDLTCAVDDNGSGRANGYGGNIIVPAEVQFNSKTYTVNAVGEGAFDACYNLYSVELPNSIISIGSHAFYRCSALTNITIPENVKTIGYKAFAGCHSLKQIVIPEKVESIDVEAFSFCENLTDVSISNSVKSIGENAFREDVSLQSVKMSECLENAGSEIFRGCSQLNQIITSNKFFLFLPRNFAGSYTIPNNIEVIAGGAFADCIGINYVSFPANTTKIGKNAFWGCNNLSSIFLPENVFEIGAGAFCGCSKLNSISIPSKVTVLNDSVFKDCISLVEIETPKNIMEIRNGAFKNCRSLKNIVIPNYCKSIDTYAFVGCKSLESFDVSSSNELYSDIDGVLYQKNPLSLVCYPNAKGNSYVVPDNTKALRNASFYGSDITSITIPSSVTMFYDEVFCDCKSLTCLKMEKSNEKLKVNGYNHFRNAPLEKIYLGRNFSVIYVGNSDFFSGLETIQDVTIASPNATGFANCKNLRNITIEEGVSEISSNAFSGCSNLSSITFPSTISSIGKNAFAGCTNVAFIQTKIPTPIVVDHSVFDMIDTKQCILIVPIGKKEIYKEVPSWSLFDNIIEADDIIPIMSISFGMSSIEMFQGDTNSLSVSIKPINATIKNIKYESNNDNILKVDANGTIKALESGEVIVTARTLDGSELSDNIKIIIKKKNTTPDVEEKCATPQISFTNGIIKFSCETDNATFFSSIKDDDIREYVGEEIKLIATYYITVYAIADGFSQSETATATLCWIDMEPKTEGMSDNIVQASAKAVLIKSEGGQLIVEGAEENTKISVYSIDGVQVGTTTSRNGIASIITTIPKDSVAIVKIGNRSLKVIMK